MKSRSVPALKNVTPAPEPPDPVPVEEPPPPPTPADEAAQQRKARFARAKK